MGDRRLLVLDPQSHKHELMKARWCVAIQYQREGDWYDSGDVFVSNLRAALLMVYREQVPYWLIVNDEQVSEAEVLTVQEAKRLIGEFGERIGSDPQAAGSADVG